MVVYKSLVDEINNRPFNCEVHVTYFMNVPDPYDNKDEIIDVVGCQYGVKSKLVINRSLPAPKTFYNPPNPAQIEPTRITLPDMVDLFVKNTFCRVVNDLDVVHLLHLCDDYLMYIKPVVVRGHKETIEFVKNLSDFRSSFLYPSFRRVARTYPDLNRLYSVYKTGINEVWLRILGDNGNDYKTGIDRLKYPPYNVRDLISKEKSEDTVTDIDGKQVPKPKEDDYLTDIFKAYK